MYVSGVSEEKELAVRDLLGDEIEFKALGMRASSVTYMCVFAEMISGQQ